MNILKSKNQKIERRHKRIRSKVIGSEERPRLSVYRSNKFIYAQLINDDKGVTIAEAHGTDATIVGSEVAKKGLAKKIDKVVFDRGGYLFLGQIKALAESARANGLKF